jgi:hypothetical protein
VTRVVLTFAAALLCACTPTVHRLAPYRSDPAAAAALERTAQTECVLARGVIPPHHFTTDGCSMWPDDGWVGCCIEHDMAYWCGGTSADRVRADATLRDCVSAVRGAPLAWLMYSGVRVGGAPWEPFPWRWAYGWDYCHGDDRPR